MIFSYSLPTRQWPEASDFDARFCTLRESKKPTAMRESRVAQRAKKCNTNPIPRATDYCPLHVPLGRDQTSANLHIVWHRLVHCVKVHA